MLLYVVLIVVCTSASSRQSPVTTSGQDHGSSEIIEAADLPVSTKPTILLVQKYPRYYVLYQLSAKEIVDSIYEKRHIGRSIRDVSSTSREGRFLFKLGANQLKNLLLWSSFLTNTAGTGTISATNSFNLFGKTINSALSLAYGDRGFIAPGIVPPVAPILPIVPPFVPPIRPFVPIVPPVLPPFVQPLIPPVTAAGTGPAPSFVSVQPILPASITVTTATNERPRITQVNDLPLVAEQRDDHQRQLMEQYLKVEKMQQKLLSDYNNLIRQQQKLTENQHENWRQFMKQHNTMIDQFNGRTFINVPRYYNT